ncbi:hypothetical protein SDC9_159158 [bioreactor metagenome]|uniref:Uncharacterized protein n=1 Tax=bioreactor metagenome TaxID=1076179 RepID=A0A645FD29_9ZZZZ
MPLAAFHGLAHPRQRRVHGIGLCQCLALDHAPHAIDVDDGRHAGHGHRYALVGLVYQQTFLGQHAEHLAQGVARNIQRFAECCFGQSLARAQHALDQLAAYFFGDAFGQVLDLCCDFHGIPFWLSPECSHRSVDSEKFKRMVRPRVCSITKSICSANNFICGINLN